MEEQEFGRGEIRGVHKRYLRSLAHELRPCLQIGKQGITENVKKQIDNDLKAHELIKINLRKVYGPERRMLGAQLAKESDSHLVQVIGCMVLLFRPHPNPKKRKITLPFLRKQA